MSKNREVPVELHNFAITTFNRATGETAEHFIPAIDGLTALRQLDDHFAVWDRKMHQHMEVHRIERV